MEFGALGWFNVAHLMAGTRFNNMYEVVFDVMQMEQSWGSVLYVFPLIFIPFLLWTIYSSFKSENGDNKLFKSFVFLFGFIAMSVFSVKLIRPFLTQNQGVLWLQKGDFKVAEGVVFNFIPQVSSGQGKENFKLTEYSFSYDFYSSSSCFKKTKDFGGPIDNGKKIRLHFNGNCILKVEVLKKT